MKLEKQQWNGLEVLTLEAGGYEAMVVPSLGANVIRLYHQATGADILRTPKEDEVEVFKSRPQIFGLPLLFPPNRIEDGKIVFEDRTYQFPITIPAENNYHHGILKSQPFQVTNTRVGYDFVEAELSFFSNAYNDAFFQSFPHEFEVNIVLHLSAKGLSQTTKVKNLSSLNMPLGVGYHTAVNIPFIVGGDAADYQLRMSAGEAWELTDRTIPTGKKLPLDDLASLPSEGIVPTGRAIEKAMDNVAIDFNGKPFYGAILKDTKHDVTVCYEVSPKFRFWTLWNNQGNVPYFCPEPQTWIHNAPNVPLPADLTGMQSLSPGNTWEAEQKFYVH